MQRSFIRKIVKSYSIPHILAKQAVNRMIENGMKFRKSNIGEETPEPSPTESMEKNDSIKLLLSNGSPSAGVRSPEKETLAPASKYDIKVLRDLNEIRHYRARAQSMKKKVALVPTMGALHDGHLRLIRRAAIDNHEVYVSIYINPTQFGVNEDLESYPKPWKKDIEKLETLNKFLIHRAEFKGRVTVVFKPTTKAMYPTLPPSSELNGHGSFVTITPLASVLEGASRPVFFRGVATVVMKLLNIVQPDMVYFGQKDIQQVLVIRRMMKDFHLNTTLRVEWTARDPKDGLALSSRNVYLGDRRRAVAPLLYKVLQAGFNQLYKERKSKREDILDPALEVAAKALRAQQKLLPSQRVRFEIDYLSLADPDTLEELQVVERGKTAILSGAMVLLPIEDPQPGENTGVGDGKLPVRLIDNIVYGMGRLFPEHRSLGAF